MNYFLYKWKKKDYQKHKFINKLNKKIINWKKKIFIAESNFILLKFIKEKILTI